MHEMKKAKAVLFILLVLVFIFMPSGPPTQPRRLGSSKPTGSPSNRGLIHGVDNPLEVLFPAVSAWLQNQKATVVDHDGYLPSNIPNVDAANAFGMSMASTNYPTDSEMTPRRVQGNARGTSIGSATSFTVTLAATPNEGNALILTFASQRYNAGATPVTIKSITQTNVIWNSSASIANPIQESSTNAIDSEIWSTTSVGANAGTVITVNIVTGGSSFVLAVADVCEYSGLSSNVDKNAVDHGLGGNPDTGTTGTTTTANELWVGSTTYTAGNAITQSSPTNSFSLLDGTDETNGQFHVSNGYLEYIAMATGAAGSRTSVNRDNDWSGCIVTFKAASTGTNESTPHRVQGNARGILAGQSGNSFTVMLKAAPANGDVLILTFGSMKGSTPAVTITSISESHVGWETSASIAETLGTINSEIWVGSVGATASPTITVNVNNSTPGCVSIANVVEYSGLSTSLDVTGVNDGSAGPPTSISTASSTSAPNELVVGNVLLTGGNNVTQISPTNNFDLLDGADVQLSTNIHASDAYLEYIASNTGTFSTGTSASHGGLWVACIAAFKAASISSQHIVTITPNVAYADSEGSVSFPEVTNFAAISVTVNLIQLNLTGTLSLNSGSAVNMTLTPSSSQHMEVSIVDRTEEVNVTSGQVASSLWFSTNSTLVIYTLTSAQWVYVSATAAGFPAIAVSGFNSDASAQVFLAISSVRPALEQRLLDYAVLS